MKKNSNFSVKLSLKKKTMANLNLNQQDLHIRGGGNGQPTFTAGCPGTIEPSVCVSCDEEPTPSPTMGC